MNRSVDDFQPHAQLRKKYDQGNIEPSNIDTIQDFSREFATAEHQLKKGLDHLELIH